MLTTEIRQSTLLVLLFIIGIEHPFTAHSSENVKANILDKTLYVFHSNNNEQSQQFYQQLIPALKQQTQFQHIKSINTSKTTQAHIAKQLSNSSHCAMTIGKTSLEKVLAIRDKTPIFSTLVSKNNLDHLINNYSRLGSRVTGIYHEQSFLRQLYLAKAINKDIEQIIIVLGRNTRYELPYYQQQTNLHSLSLLFKILNHQSSPLQFFSTLNIKNAALLIMNDPEHHSEQDLQSLLIASYQLQIPLIGGKKSDSIDAAVASIYTPLEDLINEAASNISKICMNDILPVATYSQRYRIVVNQQIAKHLNLEHINEHDLKQSIVLSEKNQLIGLKKNE